MHLCGNKLFGEVRQHARYNAVHFVYRYSNVQKSSVVVFDFYYFTHITESHIMECSRNVVCTRLYVPCVRDRAHFSISSPTRCLCVSFSLAGLSCGLAFEIHPVCVICPSKYCTKDSKACMCRQKCPDFTYTVCIALLLSLFLVCIQRQRVGLKFNYFIVYQRWFFSLFFLPDVNYVRIKSKQMIFYPLERKGLNFYYRIGFKKR